MNERIKALHDQSWEYARAQKFHGNALGVNYLQTEKFAELIVRRCAAMADFADKNPGDYVLKQFGVEE